MVKKARFTIEEREGGKFALLDEGLPYDFYDSRNAAEADKTKLEREAAVIERFEDTMCAAFDNAEFTVEEKKILEKQYDKDTLWSALGLRG